jgi:membrane AbrB-like protein
MTRNSSAARSILGWILLGISSVLTGLLAQSMGVPAGWLVGPMLVAVALALAWPESPTVPRWGRVASLTVVGGVLAAAFRPSVFPLIADYWLPVLFVVGSTLLLSLAVGYLLSWVTHLDRKAAALGTLPGAASGMLAMSDSLGADPRFVAVMQYTRVIVVVFSAVLVARFGLVPGTAPHPIPAQSLQSTASQGTFLVQDAWLVYALTALAAMLGAWTGTRLRLPAGALIGPLVFGVALEMLGVMRLTWPPGVPQTAFLVIGLWAGLHFDRASIKSVGGLFPFVLASAAGLTVACVGLGWALTVITPIDGLTAYLATTPGGIDSVAVIALESGADAPLVLAVQMLRLFAVILAGSLLGRWWSS